MFSIHDFNSKIEYNIICPKIYRFFVVGFGFYYFKIITNVFMKKKKKEGRHFINHCD